MIDNITVAAYFIIVLFVALYKKSNATSLKQYASVDQKYRNNKFMLVATIFATAVGGGTMFGLAEKAFVGTLAFSYALLLTVIFDILIAICIVPKLSQHYGATSMGDIMAKYYGQVGRVVTGVAALLISVGYLAAQISVSGKIFQYILDVSLIEGVVISYVVVIIYTTIGGLQSVVLANSLQFVVMLCSVPLISIIGINEIGFENFCNLIPSEKVSLADPDLLQSTLLIALSFSVMGFYPSFIQRALINRKAETVRSAILIKSSVYVVFVGFVSVNGLIAYVKYDSYDAAMAIPHLIDQLMPIGLKGFVVVGLLAAVMSTADSDLNIASISIVQDILQPIIGKSQKTLVQIARMTTILIGSISIILALRFNNAVDLVIFSAGLWAPMVSVSMIAAFFGYVIRRRYFLFVSIIGAGSFVWWCKYGNINLNGVFVGVVMSLISFIFFAIFTKRKPSSVDLTKTN